MQMTNQQREQVRREMEYLAEKGLLASVEKEVSPENSAWRITAKGRDFLAMQQQEEVR
jgi:predicted transcriptional regulator